MILFDNWTIRMLSETEPLAQQYDDGSRRIDVEGDLPEGYTWQLLVQCRDNADTILLTPTQKGVGTVLTADNLSQAGNYYLQLRGTLAADTATKRHTNIISVYVPQSLTGLGTWPEVPTEFAQAEARILELYGHPPVPGSGGCWLVWDEGRGEYVESQLALPDVSVGPPGPAGFSPTVSLTETEEGVRIDVTDWDGTRSAAVLNGRNGQPGAEGAPGPAGADGKSAYQYARDGGYTGTEGEFAEKLAKEIPDAYVLPVAEPAHLGGVQPSAKTDDMTQAVGVDDAGGLWTAPGGNAGMPLLFEVNLAEDVQRITFPLDTAYSEFLVACYPICAGDTTSRSYLLYGVGTNPTASLKDAMPIAGEQGLFVWHIIRVGQNGDYPFFHGVYYAYSGSSVCSEFHGSSTEKLTSGPFTVGTVRGHSQPFAAGTVLKVYGRV